MGNIVSNLFSSDIQTKVDLLEREMDKNKDNVVTKQELESYFNFLSDKIDNNNDGIISKSELKSYVSSQIGNKDAEIEKYKKMYEEEKLKTEIYQEEIDRLKTYLNFATGEDSVERQSYISNLAIKDYIQTNHIETDSNIKFLPDAIERKILFSSYKTSLESLEQLCNTTTLELMNHKIKLSIESSDKYDT